MYKQGWQGVSLGDLHWSTCKRLLGNYWVLLNLFCCSIIEATFNTCAYSSLLYLLWKKVDVTKQLNSAKHIKCYYHWITNIISIHTIQTVMTQDLLTIFAMNQQKWITPALKIPVDLYIKVSKLQKSIKN